MARSTQKTVVTAADLLAHIKSAQPTAVSAGLGITDWLADQTSGVVDRFGKLSGALVESTGNFMDHYKMERSVQQVRSTKRLEAAAARAAERINAALAH